MGALFGALSADEMAQRERFLGTLAEISPNKTHFGAKKNPDPPKRGLISPKGPNTPCGWWQTRLFSNRGG
jgi:hypothetical protein